MNNKLLTIIFATATFTIWGVVLTAQQSHHVSGFDAGPTSISIGQTVYVLHSGTSGSATEGVQQIDCPEVAASDTAGCPLDTLSQMVAQEQGGIWQMISSIGSTIDSTGRVTLGLNTTTEDDIDTVHYLLYGCTTEVLIVVHPYPTVNAINGGPYCAGDLGHLYETGGDGVSWFWIFPSGFSSQKKNPAVGPVVAGDYVVEVTDANGCVDRDTSTVCVSNLAQLCQSTVDVYLDADGEGNFNPVTLLGGTSQSPCSLGSVTPDGLQSFGCADVGNTDLFYTIIDSIGCSEDCTTQVLVKDTISPTPGCTSGDPVVLVWEGTQLMPSSLAGSTADNCGGGLEYSFSEDFSTSSLTLTCTEKLRGGSMAVQVFIRDDEGNVADCSVTLGYAPESEDCNCQDDVLTFGGSVTSADYKAKQTISSNGMIAVGDTVLFKAQQSITLTPGFLAAAGSFFGARIDSCTLTTPDFAEGRDNAESRLLADIFSTIVYPNPFRNVVSLNLELPERASVSMTLHNSQGQVFKQLLSRESLSAGFHKLDIDGSQLPPGVYVLRIQADQKTATHRIVKIQ